MNFKHFDDNVLGFLESAVRNFQPAIEDNKQLKPIVQKEIEIEIINRKFPLFKKSKPCMFCDNKKIMLLEHPSYYIKCDTCEARGPIKNNANDAIIAWGIEE